MDEKHILKSKDMGSCSAEDKRFRQYSLNSGNQRIVHTVCVNYIYHKMGFFEMLFVYCIFVCLN